MERSLPSFFDELEKIGYQFIPVPIPQTSKGRALLAGAAGLLTVAGLGTIAYKRHKNKPQREQFEREFNRQLGEGVSRKAAYSRARSAAMRKAAGAVEALGRGLPSLHFASKRVSAGERRHMETMRAIEEGYPAGWVPLKMRPLPEG